MTDEQACECNHREADHYWTCGTCNHVAPYTERQAGLREPAGGLVCSLCLFVGDSDDPEPVTIINGNLTCEPHNGYFQGGDHVQAIIAWKREHPAENGHD